jgi:protein-S-isoprenylcysteine O-methyltransferase
MWGGLTIRFLAFYAAKGNFTHHIEMHKKGNHKLVTNGVYRYERHPGYLGYYLFSLGAMILIGNWVCLVLYFIVLTRFFRDRIEYEEETLVYLFP